MPTGKRPGVLVLARNYPNRAIPVLGLWTERFVEASRASANPVVVAPVGYVPPGVPIPSFSRFRKVPRVEERRGIVVHHPRVPALPGYVLHRFDARLQSLALRRTLDRLVEDHSVDLIHAHFIYPEGVVGAELGRRHGIPVLTTEGAMWRPWLDRFPSVRRQVLDALGHIRMVTVVSRALERTVQEVAGGAVPTMLLPNIVEEDVFGLPPSGASRDPDRIIFVGAVRHVKGLDVLVQALPRVIAERPKAHLVVVGDPFFRQYQRDQQKVEDIIARLGLLDRVRFTGPVPAGEVARKMGESAVLAVPSRRESFGVVIIEALATGTPVVATRCGGPEEIIVDSVGRLVDVEDPDGLAHGLLEVMDRPGRFPPERLRHYAVERWGQATSEARISEVYRRVLEGGDQGPGAGP